MTDATIPPQRPRVVSQPISWQLALAGIFIIAAIVRWRNVVSYNTWWADDGGAHVQYVQAILDHGRLPTMQESYLAWHEPLWYAVVAGWQRLGELVGRGGINWWEGLLAISGLWFLWLVWRAGRVVNPGRVQPALLVVSLFAVLFVGVKLSAYVNNELPAQAVMLLATLLWLRFRLDRPARWGKVAIWSLILALATLTKLTAVVVGVAAILAWGWLAWRRRQRALLGYAAVAVVIVALVNLPWLFYKQRHFGAAFAVNLFERGKAQPIIGSAGWPMVWRFNPKLLTDNPFFSGATHSLAAVLFAEPFADYYNLFTQLDEVSRLPEDATRVAGNGRVAPLAHWTNNIRLNRLGLLLASLWLVGLAGAVRSAISRGTLAERWLLLVVAGSWAALLYHALRYPFPERGVLKASFIYFTLPIMAALAYRWWWSVLPRWWLRFAVLVLPVAAYAVAAVSVIFV